jgi:tRNA threonylcarbamoyladenosine biosynthesis protein TsaE
VRTPVVFALRGELGAGKSVFARAIARGAGVTAAMPSPTFNLLFRYETPRGLTVSHLDLYRLDDADEVWELGWRELGDGNEIVLIEWPERAEHLLPGRRWDITLRNGTIAETRVVSAVPVNDPPVIPAPK